MPIESHHLRFAQTLAITDRNIDGLAPHVAGLPAALFAPTPAGISPDFVLADFGALGRMLASPAMTSSSLCFADVRLVR